MVQICLEPLLDFAFDCFDFRMVRICIRMRRIAFEWLECFEFCSNGVNFIGMHWISFEWLEFAFECFDSHSNSLNLHSNASNPFPMVRISIWMLWISFEVAFEWLESLFNVKIAFKCFETRSNGSNLHLNASNPFWMVRICIRVFKSRSHSLNFHSNG